MRDINRFQPRGADRPGADAKEHNTAVLLNAGLTAAVCVFLASLLPRELAAWFLGSLLQLAAAVSATIAAAHGESLRGDRLTHWDMAAGFLLLGLVAAWFVDPEAVRAVLATAAAAKPN